jgi:hypothetical protein
MHQSVEPPLSCLSSFPRNNNSTTCVEVKGTKGIKLFWNPNNITTSTAIYPHRFNSSAYPTMMMKNTNGCK